MIQFIIVCIKLMGALQCYIIITVNMHNIMHDMHRRVEDYLYLISFTQLLKYSRLKIVKQ